ncbi:unnamed protein product [Lupinus luteus]|uniref:Uncharacterized protein n=1 Tax=Lupinus luteus TaxID=3873 RepID=A0AAV1VST3_LUPLU
MGSVVVIQWNSPKHVKQISTTTRKRTTLTTRIKIPIPDGNVVAPFNKAQMKLLNITQLPPKMLPLTVTNGRWNIIPNIPLIEYIISTMFLYNF